MSNTLVIHANALALILTLVIPVAVALVAKEKAHPAIKAVLTMIFAALVAFLNAHQTAAHEAVFSAQMVFDFVLDYVPDAPNPFASAETVARGFPPSKEMTPFDVVPATTVAAIQRRVKISCFQRPPIRCRRRSTSA